MGVFYFMCNWNCDIYPSLIQFCFTQGSCLDKSKVYGEVKYEHAVFNQESCQRVVRSLKNIRDVIHNDFVLHAYEVQLSR